MEVAKAAGTPTYGFTFWPSLRGRSFKMSILEPSEPSGTDMGLKIALYGTTRKYDSNSFGRFNMALRDFAGLSSGWRIRPIMLYKIPLLGSNELSINSK